MGWGISREITSIRLKRLSTLTGWFSEAGRRAYAYGIEGVDYTMVNGEPQYTEQLLNVEGGVPMYMRDHGQLEYGAPMSIQAEIDAMTPEAKRRFALYNDNRIGIRKSSRHFPTRQRKSVSSRIRVRRLIHLSQSVSRSGSWVQRISTRHGISIRLT